MPALIAGLAASVASFLVASFTGKPAITVTTDSKSENQQAFFKWGFFALCGLAALQLVKKFRK